jgi:hypothetical protein
MLKNVHRTQSLAFEIAQANARMREVIASSFEILRTLVPDTFLGRKTQDPFSTEKQGLLRSSPAVNKVPDALQDSRAPSLHASLPPHQPPRDIENLIMRSVAPSAAILLLIFRATVDALRSGRSL